MNGNARDLALFNLAIDSKLRGCDGVTERVEDVAPSGYSMDRATVRRMKTGRPVRFEPTRLSTGAGRVPCGMAGRGAAPTAIGVDAPRHMTHERCSSLRFTRRPDMIARNLPARRAILALAIVCPWSPAMAETCASAYHGALRAISAERDTRMSQIGSRLRQPVDGTPGRWFTGLPQSGRGTQERPCLEVAVTRGRERCVRFAAPLPREVEVQSRPSADELRALAGLSEIIRGRGIVSDLSTGRSAGVLQRVAAEVRGYVNQPANPALCAGGRDLVQFYLRQAEPVGARLADAKRLAATITTLAAQRLRSAVAADAAQIARQAEAPKTPVPDQPTAQAATGDSRVVPASRPEPAVLTVETYAALTVPAMLTEAGRAVGATGAADASSRSIAAALKQISEALRSAPLGDEVRAAHWAALRMIEARFYADMLVSRYEDADTAVIGALRDIGTAHLRHCTCGS